MLLKNAVTFLPLTLASQLSIQLNSSSENFEIGSSQEISCQYSHQIEGDLPYELTWSKNDVPFVSLSHFDDYQAIPVISSAPSQNVDLSRYNFNYVNSTFSLEIPSVEIADQGNYACSVRILKAQVQENGSLAYLFESASTQINVFANPTVSFNYENAGSFDIRAGQVENNNLANLIGNCQVANAYPQPESISIQVGNQPAFALNLEAEAIIVDEVSSLISYSNLPVSKVLSGEDHLASVSCVAESRFYRVANEVDAELILNVQCILS